MKISSWYTEALENFAVIEYEEKTDPLELKFDQKFEELLTRRVVRA